LELGSQPDGLAWVDGGAGREGKDAFAGIDTPRAAIAAPLADGAAKREIAVHLAAAEALAVKARAALAPARLADAAAPLAEILKHLRAARALLTGDGEERGGREGDRGVAGVTRSAVADLLDEKIA